MEQPIEVLVSPANDDNSFLESVSTHSNGRGEGEKYHCSDDDDDDEEFKQDNLNVPKMLGSDQGGVEDESHAKMETVRNGSAGRGNDDGSSSAPLANITRTLQLAKSWLNKSRQTAPSAHHAWTHSLKRWSWLDRHVFQEINTIITRTILRALLESLTLRMLSITTGS